MQTDDHSRAVFNLSVRVSSNRALPPGPPHGVPSHRDAPFLELSFIHHSKSPVYESPLLIPGSLGRKGAPKERDAHIRSLS